MTRRHLFLTAAAASLAVVLPLEAAALPSDLRAVFRYNYATDSWHRCRMWELRKGDVFRVEDISSALRAQGEPVKDCNGIWTITADSCDGRAW